MAISVEYYTILYIFILLYNKIQIIKSVVTVVYKAPKVLRTHDSQWPEALCFHVVCLFDYCDHNISRKP